MMSNTTDGIVDGLVRGLKRILFTTADKDDAVAATVPAAFTPSFWATKRVDLKAFIIMIPCIWLGII